MTVTPVTIGLVISSSVEMKLFPLLFLLLASGAAGAQTQFLSPEMKEAANKVHEAFGRNLKGWTREDVQPFGNESDIIVENWKTNEHRVRVSVALMHTGSDSIQWLADFLRRNTRARQLDGIGDAAAVWGYADSVVTFHTGAFNVSVSSSADFKLFGSYGNGKDLNEAEAAATSKLMACFVNMALNGDLSPARIFRGESRLKRPCEQELMRKGLLNDPGFFERF